jgi:hypothetical protein
MKLIFLLFILLFSFEINAKANLLLQCLAKEEEKLHIAKDQSALYRLNQNFLNELASNNDISIKKNFVDEICNQKKGSPSVEFLHLLLIKESDIYDLSLSEVDGTMRPFKMGYINEFQKQVPHLLIAYLSGLQSEVEDPNCLNNAIPEIKILTEKIKYLEEEISMHQIVSDKKKIETIFKKLKNFKEIKNNCLRKEQKKLKLIKEKNKKS